MLGAAATTVVTAAPPGSGTTYTAVFGHAGAGLDTRSDVKVRGITVGGVESVDLTREGKVRVSLRVDDDVAVPADSEARIDPVSVFGPKEISLDLGHGPALSAGGRITKTIDPSDPSETAEPLYRTAKAIDPQDLTTLMHTFAEGLSGQGPALRRTIGNSATVVDAAYADRAQIRTLINDITGLSGTLGNRGDTIVATGQNLNSLSEVATSRPDKVGLLLDQATSLSTRVGDNLEGHGTAMGRIVDGAGGTASVVAAQNANLPVLADSLNGFFSGLAAVMTAPGPEGTNPAVLRGTLPLDLCGIIVDLCPTPPQTSP